MEDKNNWKNCNSTPVSVFLLGGLLNHDESRLNTHTQTRIGIHNGIEGRQCVLHYQILITIHNVMCYVTADLIEWIGLLLQNPYDDRAWACDNGREKKNAFFFSVTFFFFTRIYTNTVRHDDYLDGRFLPRSFWRSRRRWRGPACLKWCWCCRTWFFLFSPCRTCRRLFSKLRFRKIRAWKFCRKCIVTVRTYYKL